jgi:hypothetical protein
LVVIGIILLISAIALPTVLPAISHRQVSEAARLLQAALVGARDEAIHTNAPSGIRLLPDPVSNGLNPNAATPNTLDSTQILACNRIIPIQTAPEYTEGRVSIIGPPGNLNINVAQWVIPAGANPNPLLYPVQTTALPQPQIYPLANLIMITESVLDPTNNNVPNSPTSWFWNIRIGDRIQINNAGPWYTVVGPMAIGPSNGNTELFVNVGVPGIASPLKVVNPLNLQSPLQPEFLFLVNGQDDNNNGWVDEGWDNVNNNFNFETANGLKHLIDEVSEWETEQWLGAAASVPIVNQAYTIQRRPAPGPNAREIALPSNVVIDLTSWNGTAERSRLPIDPNSGAVDIVVNPDGSIVPTTVYSSPSSFGMGSAFFHFWLAERSDLAAPDSKQANAPFLPVPQGLAPTRFASGAQIKGEYRLITVFSRTGQITTNDTVPFDSANIGTANYNVNLPFQAAQQGVQGSSQ